MHSSTVNLFIVLIILIGISGFFSASEIGMMSLNRYRLRYLVKKNNKKAVRISKMLAHPERLLSVVLIGNTLANILASMLATLLGQRLYGEVGIAIATLLLSLVILIVAEMIPKTFAALYPQKIAFACSLGLSILQKTFAPLVYVISKITNLVLHLFGTNLDKNIKENLSREELRFVVHEAGSLIPSEHKNMLISVLDLEQTTVEDIIISKTDIIGINLNQPWEEIFYQLETAQYTRLPLYYDHIDNLIGTVHLREVLQLTLNANLTKDLLISLVEAPYFIPEATPLNIQLLNFQKIKKRNAFVVDEYGELQGLVTMEDILAEIVGEFANEIALKDIIPQKDNSYLVDASMNIRQLNRTLNWQLPLIGPRTLSGLIIEKLGYIPPSNCCLIIEKYQIDILKVKDNIIKNVRILKVKSNALL